MTSLIAASGDVRTSPMGVGGALNQRLGIQTRSVIAIGIATIAAMTKVVRHPTAFSSAFPPATPRTPPMPIAISPMPIINAKRLAGATPRTTDASAGVTNAAAAPRSERARIAVTNPSLRANMNAERPASAAIAGSSRATPKRSINNPAGNCITANANRHDADTTAERALPRSSSVAISDCSGANRFSTVTW